MQRMTDEAQEHPTDRAAEEPSAASELTPLVYDELRRLAASFHGSPRSGDTLQPTALVHEAYLRMAGKEGGFNNRSHFVCVAAKAMRQILVDHARARGAVKRGGDWQRVTIAGLVGEENEEVDLLDLEAALDQLAQSNERAARIAELRLFGGLGIPETAAAIDMSERTVKYDWRFARAWLRKMLHGDEA